LIDVKSLPRTFRAAIDAHQGGASCTPYDAIVAVKPSMITGLSVVVSLRGDSRMAMLRWEPFREIENALRRFAPLYMPDNGVARDETAARTWMPLANISESENEYLIVLPDCVEANGIRAEAKDGVLSIHVPKAETKKSDPLAIEVH
jgi:HSP20 family molecular chaperone IbpA